MTTTGKKIRLLIVDDEVEIRMSISRFLTFLPEFESLVILQAATFEQAMAMVEAERPLIILQDINLPDGNGLELISQVNKVYPIIQCIVITGASNLNRVIDAISYGAVDYLKKPMDMDVLRKIMVETMDRCTRWGELFHEEYSAGERLKDQE